MSKKSIDERLKAHPLLEGRIEAILDIVEDSAREVGRADEAERRMIEEVRQLVGERSTAGLGGAQGRRAGGCGARAGGRSQEER